MSILETTTSFLEVFTSLIWIKNKKNMNEINEEMYKCIQMQIAIKI